MAAGVSALPASAYKIGGAPWPHGRIPYYNAASWKQTVQDAIRAWDTSGAHGHFVAVSRRRAGVVISDLSARSSPETDGEAIIGYNGPGFVNYVLVMSRRQAKAKGRLRDNVTHIDVHELGHTLGLDHPRPGCSVMDSAGIDCPMPRGSWQSRCRLLEKDDIRG